MEDLGFHWLFSLAVEKTPSEQHGLAKLSLHWISILVVFVLPKRLAFLDYLHEYSILFHDLFIPLAVGPYQFLL